MISSFIIAFAMYSKIPMPKVSWTEDKMKYAICFFPWVGAVIGGLVYGGFYLFLQFHLTDILKTILLLLIPVFITGGIHLDGFLDTIDARSSYRDREEKLRILKDSNAGAFAVIGCAVYFLLSFGFWSELNEKILPILGISFVYSRALSGLGAVTLKGARKKGLLASFSAAAEKKAVLLTMIAYLIFCVIAMIWFHPMKGGVCAAAGALIYIYYWRFSYKEFGGVTGDLAGYFLQICELGMLISLVIVEKWMTG